MGKKVTKLPKNLHSKRLAKSYPRIERNNRDLSANHLKEAEAPYYPAPSAEFVYAVTKKSPFENYELAHEIDLQTTVPYFNSLLLYRIFKLLYGQHDLLGAFIEPDLATPKVYAGAGIEWGYTLKILEDLYAEIRSINMNNRFRLRFWMKSVPETKVEKKPYSEKMAKFFSDLIDCIDKNCHLFNEEQELKANTASDSAITNIFSEKYQSAEYILNLAKNIDILPESKDLEFGEKLKTSTGGALFLSSAVLFVIAIESLINTIYHLLLKPDFKAEAYERVTVRADLDIRLISAHVFCSGFKRQILRPHTGLWKRLLKFRRFRNDIVHGNITPDHHIYALREDINTFFYCGLTDFRGRKAENKAQNRYPTTMAYVDQKVVLELKETVDLILKAIIDAADDENSNWIKNWIWEAMIPKSMKG